MNIKYFSRLVPVLVSLLLVVAASSWAADKDMGGWEEGGTYDSFYKASELDKIKCRVVKVTEVVPMKGMAPGIALIVDDGDGEKITVHVGPKWFLGGSVAIKRGDKLKIKGSWAEIDGKDVYMASKIKKGDYYVLKVRLTKNGKPFWAMTPEELEKERAAAK